MKWQNAGSHGGRTELYCDSRFVVILQRSVVLWLKGAATNLLQIFKSICYSSDQDRRESLTVVTCRSVEQFPLKHLCVSTDITVSFGSRQQSVLQQFGLIVKAPATVIPITVLCIIVCSGSRTNKERMSGICSCGVEIWIRSEVMKTFVWLLSNLNGIKKRVEKSSVDAILSCENCVLCCNIRWLL
jgi:hypothetical protein